MPPSREHCDLVDEGSGPSCIPINIPIARLPSGCRSKHPRCLSALRVDLDHAGDIDLEALNDGWAVGLVLDQHGTDGPVRIPLSPNFGFGGGRVQMLVDNVENIPLSAFDPDDADRDEV